LRPPASGSGLNFLLIFALDMTIQRTADRRHNPGRILFRIRDIGEHDAPNDSGSRRRVGILS
jgi:hypothetical protein